LNSRTRDRLFHFLSRPALLGLALSVFVWGLAYKLSLYEPPPHQVPTAKLLSRDEQAGISTQASFTEWKSVTGEQTVWIAAVLVMVAGAALDPPVSTRLHLALDAPHKPFRARYAALFVRPPPCLPGLTSK
jgi:hypothetical protein